MEPKIKFREFDPFDFYGCRFYDTPDLIHISDFLISYQTRMLDMDRNLVIESMLAVCEN